MNNATRQVVVEHLRTLRHLNKELNTELNKSLDEMDHKKIERIIQDRTIPFACCTSILELELGITDKELNGEG
jgi:hypothetical protein